MSNALALRNQQQIAAVVPDNRHALEPTNIEQGFMLADVVVKAKLFGVASREDALARMGTGMGLGLTAWQSLRGLHVINGKVGLAADLMLALCRRSPDCEYVRCTRTDDKVATFEAKRKSDPAPTTLSFTLEDAKRAGLLNNSMYAKYPANMLRARCGANLARLMFPEELHGIYTPEELHGIEVEQAAPRPAPVAARQSARVVEAAPEEPFEDEPPTDPALLALAAEARRRIGEAADASSALALADAFATTQGLPPDLLAEVRADAARRAIELAADVDELNGPVAKFCAHHRLASLRGTFNERRDALRATTPDEEAAA